MTIDERAALKAALESLKETAVRIGVISRGDSLEYKTVEKWFAHCVAAGWLVEKVLKDDQETTGTAAPRSGSRLRIR